MSAPRRRGSDSMRVTDRHGARGDVVLAVGVPPELKDHLVEYCEYAGVTLKEAVQLALSEFLYEARP